MLVHKGGKIKNWGGECREVTPTKLQSQRSANEDFLDKSIKEIEVAAECDMRLFWKLIKGKYKKQSGSCVELIIDNSVISKSDMVLSAFESFYKDLSIPKVNPLFDQAYTIEIEERFKLLVVQKKIGGVGGGLRGGGGRGRVEGGSGWM